MIFFELHTICIVIIMIAYTLQKLSNRKLVRKCAQPSEDWQQFWNEFDARFGEAILLYIYRELQKTGFDRFHREVHQTVLDLKQDVYIKLLQREAEALKNFRGHNEDSIFKFLYIISKNVVLNFIKNLQRAKRAPQAGLLPIQWGHGDSYLALASNETVEELEWRFLQESIVATLKRRCAGQNVDRDIKIFKLYFFNGLQAKEIANELSLNLTQSGIETVISRMRASLLERKT